MYEDTKKYIKFCDNCQRRGQKGGKSYLNPIEVREPFERIGIDFVESLEKTRRGNRYILVVTNYLTKWPETKAMKDATATNVVKFIYEVIICKHRCPKIILSDRGTHFKTYGREATLPIDEIEIQENISERESILKRTYDIINLTEEREEARKNVKRSQEKQKERYDKKIGEETKLKIGDKVLLKDAAKEKQ